jgi:hypothetical protein
MENKETKTETSVLVNSKFRIIDQYVDQQTTVVVVKEKGYNEKKKEAIYKYRDENREKINEKRRQKYKEKCDNDPEFRKKLNEKNQKYIQQSY